MALSTARTEAKAAFGDACGLSRKISRKAAPHRNPDSGRRPRRRHPSRRARLLAAAPSPEGAGRKALARRSTPTQRDKIGEICAKAHARHEVSRRRHHRVPVRGRRVLFHRDEHPHPGRASRHRDDHRHRSRARADPRRRRRRSALPARTRSRIHRPRHRVPRQCRRTRSTFRPSPGKILHYHPPGGLGVRDRFRRLSGLHHPALLRLDGRQADRPRQDAAGMPDAAEAGLGRDSWSTAWRPRCRCSGRWSANQDIIDGNYSIHWLEQYLADRAA